MRFWPPVTDDLPAPRDDEPSSLRQDIADELADHLNCAFTRELHLARDEEKAKENALDRFGDPRRIARKLWLDAMQEKLMSQRMTFVALVVVLLASLGSTALTWFLVDQARQVNQTMLDQSREANAALLAQSQELLAQSRDSNRALVEQGQKANEALLAKLGDLQASGSQAADSTGSLEWNPVKIRLVTDEQPPKPAAGYEAKLTGRIRDAGKDASSERKSDEQGIADFGLVRPGDHTLDVVAPWMERHDKITITVFPGHPLTRTISCPARELQNVPVEFAVDWPDDLKNKGLWVACKFFQEPRSLDDDGSWSIDFVKRFNVILVSPDNRVLSFSLPPLPTRQPLSARGVRPLHEQGRNQLIGLQLNHDDRFIRQSPQLDFIFWDSTPQAVLQWASATHHVQELVVAMPPQPVTEHDQFSFIRKSPKDGVDLELLRKCRVVGGLVLRADQLDGQSGWREIKDRQRILIDWIPDDDSGERTRDWHANVFKALPRIVATPGQSNHFRIPIPDRLAAVVRESLSAQEAGQPSAKSE